MSQATEEKLLKRLRTYKGIILEIGKYKWKELKVDNIHNLINGAQQ
jgi:hypothetical protein